MRRKSSLIFRHTQQWALPQIEYLFMPLHTDFIEKGIYNNFNDVTETAEHDMLNFYLRRNPELIVLQAEGVFVDRARG
jgi:hypothetical protein